MHPAIDVYRNQLLLEVGQENAKLENEISRLEASADFLGGIELHLADGSIMSTGIKQSFVVNDFNGVPCLCSPLVNCPAFPLSHFRSGQVRMAGHQIGTFPGVTSPSLTIDGCNCASCDIMGIRLKIIFSPFSIVEGALRGLSSEDVSRIKHGTYGDQHVMEYLQRNEHSTLFSKVQFVPDSIFMVVTKDLQETIKVLGPLPRFKTGSDVSGDPLPLDPEDCI